MGTALKIIERSANLADKTIKELYLFASPDCNGSIYLAKQELGKCSRGKLIQLILEEEFYEFLLDENT